MNIQNATIKNALEDGELEDTLVALCEQDLLDVYGGYGFGGGSGGGDGSGGAGGYTGQTGGYGGSVGASGLYGNGTGSSSGNIVLSNSTVWAIATWAIKIITRR
jgi:hypothetical protein